MEDKKIEVIQGNKKIIYKIETEDGEYKGISINIMDLTKPVMKGMDLSLNLSLYINNIETNFHPDINTRLIEKKGWRLRAPKESYTIEDDIGEDALKRIFKGKYLGNIVCNTMDAKKVVCFISQKEEIRYYHFLDLTDTDVLACSEWDLDYEYLGFCDEIKKEQHEEYLRRIKQMELEFSFATQIGTNNEEVLIEYNGEEVTKEAIEKYDTFKDNIMALLKSGYALEQKEEKTNIETK